MRTLSKNYLNKLLITVALVACLSIASTAFAQEIQRTYTIINPAIVHTLNPGQRAEGVTKVINQSNVELTFKLNVQDYIVTDTKGTPNILPPDTLNSKYSAAAWIGVSPSTFTLKPGATQVVSYFIQIPPNAAPGGHYAAIVYAPTTVAQEQATGGTVNTQVGSLFYLTVNGPVKEKAEVSKFETNGFSEYGPVKILTQVKNMGDLHINPKAKITVSGLFFNEKQDLLSQNIYPQTARDFENTFGSLFMLGRYKADFVGSYGKENNLPLVASLYFWVFPWRLALVITLAVIAIILGTIYLKRKKEKGSKPQDESRDEATKPYKEEKAS
ncbi:MAG: hypothetical protein HY344_03920 [Candidatus Levybacteria bacterium]|nr:hypothetical protein [Candidatus Levybacteria bacterium]